MGTWGAGIFADDVAQDIRDEWIDLFKTHASGVKATAELREACRDEFDDDDNGPVARLVLALTLWKYGCLDDRSKSEALDVIDNHRGLARWEEQGPAAVRARLKVYAETRTKLLSPQPPSKELTAKPRKVKDAGLRPGDIFSIPLPSPHAGRGYLRVIDLRETREERSPLVQLLAAPADTDAGTVDWATMAALRLRNYQHTQDPNLGVERMYLINWGSRGTPKTTLQRHATLDASAYRDAAAPSRFPDGATSWSELSQLVVRSLDTSHWMTEAELNHLIRSTPEDQIESLRPRLELAAERTTHGWAYIGPPAYKLMVLDGDYAKALRVLDLADTVAPTPSWTEERAHALYGLGQTAAAEECWRQFLNEGRPNQREFRERKVKASRNEVDARRAGTPLTPPSWTHW